MTKAAEVERTAGQGPLRSRFGRRLFLVLLGCALLPLVGFAGTALLQIAQGRSERVEASLHADARSAGMKVADRLQRAVDGLGLASASTAVSRASTDALAAVVDEHLRREFAALWLQDGEQTMPLVGTPLRLPALSRGARAHLAAGQPLLQVLAGPEGLASKLAMMVRLRGTEADERLLVGEIGAALFGDLEVLRERGSEVFVLTQDCRMLAWTSTQPPDFTQLRATLGVEPAAGTLELDVVGARHLARYWRMFLRPRFGVDLIVVQSLPMEIATAPVEAFQRTFGLAAVLTLCVVVGVALSQVRRILQPIRRLLATTRRVAGGDLDARAELAIDDEIGELGRSFDAMTRALVDNIRRRELTEVELRAARDDALDAAHAKAEFLTNVSHELRTPLTAIVSAVEILQQFDDADPATRTEFLSGIAGESRRLAQLVERVLELNDHRVPELAPVSLADTLRRAVDALPEAVRARVELLLPPDLPLVLGEAGPLQQVWSFLLDNAARFSGPATPIRAIARAVDGVCEVDIVDRGVGIAAADFERVFEPFCQIGFEPLTAKTGGLGLGLTLARRIVNRHGGRLSVASELGVGSTFQVALPALVPAETERSAATSSETAVATAPA